MSSALPAPLFFTILCSDRKIAFPILNPSTVPNLDTTYTPVNMSFSNADTSDKPADPYKKANADEVSLDQKISDFKSFIEATKFVMMTVCLRLSE